MNIYFTYKPLEEDRSLGKINGKDLIIPARSNLINLNLMPGIECVQIYYKRTEPGKLFNQKEGLGEQYFPKEYASQLETLLEGFGRRVRPEAKRKTVYSELLSKIIVLVSLSKINRKKKNSEGSQHCFT